MRRLVLLVSLVSAPAVTQQTVIVSPPPMVVGQVQSSVLLAGTSVPLRLTTELTTKDKRFKVGDRFNLETTEAVTLNGVTVIPMGSLAVGEVTVAQPGGMFGKGAKLEARMIYVRANGRQMRITGRLDNKGGSNGVAVAAATYLTLVGGAFIKGKNAVIPIGTTVTAYLEEDMPVTFAPGINASNAMVISAEAPKPAPPPSGK